MARTARRKPKIAKGLRERVEETIGGELEEVRELLKQLKIRMETARDLATLLDELEPEPPKIEKAGNVIKGAF